MPTGRKTPTQPTNQPKPNDVTCAYQAGGREGRVGQRGQKEILPEGGIDEMY